MYFVLNWLQQDYWNHIGDIDGVVWNRLRYAGPMPPARTSEDDDEETTPGEREDRGGEESHD